MDAGELIQYLDNQQEAIRELIDQLDEVQVAFNARFDEFRAQHNSKLELLTDQVSARLQDMSPTLQSAIEERLQEEVSRIDKRREEVRVLYLPERRQAADSLLEKAQAELAELRALNPQLDKREEGLKRQRATLEARLVELNEEIRSKSRGLGLVRHFLAIAQADRERQRVIGKVESVNESLYAVRNEWNQERGKVEDEQAEYQRRWQLESMSIARLQAELDQLNDTTFSEELALRRAVRYVLDSLKEPSPGSAPKLDAGLREMAELNIQSDLYQAGLSSVGGLIGLLRGVVGGLEAIRHSIVGLMAEQQMHEAYLSSLVFHLPPGVEQFNSQWSSLTRNFSDETTLGAHPSDFSDAVAPLLDGALSQESIESMFGQLGAMIDTATARW